MAPHAGMLIRSTELQKDSSFENVSILVTELNADGAVGFVVNKPFARKLNELEEFNGSPAFPLFDGGPVGRENLYFIHRRPELIHGGTAINDHVFMGGDFKTAIKFINDKIISESDVKIFVGYCGWNAGELEEEIKEGSWTVEEAEILN
jgi:putative transcriptional regulator